MYFHIFPCMFMDYHVFVSIFWCIFLYFHEHHGFFHIFMYFHVFVYMWWRISLYFRMESYSLSSAKRQTKYSPPRSRPCMNMVRVLPAGPAPRPVANSPPCIVKVLMRLLKHAVWLRDGHTASSRTNVGMQMLSGQTLFRKSIMEG